MNDDTVRLSMIGQVFRRRWRLLIVFAILGAVVGAGTSLLLSPGYQTATNVLLQGTRQADELETETQVATSSVVLDRAATVLGPDYTGAELADIVDAKVLDGNVIAVSASAATPELAQKIADRVAAEYVTFSTKLSSNTLDAGTQLLAEQQQALRDQVKQTNDRITALHNGASGNGSVESVQARTELESLRSALNAAMTTLANSETASSRTGLVVMGPAPRPSAEAAPTQPQLIAGGALAGFLVGVLGHLFSARSDRRLRQDSAIGAAAGTSVAGSVTVPAASHSEPGAAGNRSWLGWLRTLVQLDRPWTEVPPSAGESERDRNVRYQRLVHRLRGPDGALRAVVVAADDDPAAHRAIARLAHSAGTDGPSADVFTDDPAFERLLADAGDTAGGAAPVVHADGALPRDSDRTVLWLSDVATALPAVPEVSGISDAVLVVTAGTRTDWELADMAQACVEAGYRIAGVVIVRRCRPAAPADQAHPDASRPSVTDNAMAGVS